MIRKVGKKESSLVLWLLARCMPKAVYAKRPARASCARSGASAQSSQLLRLARASILISFGMAALWCAGLAQSHVFPALKSAGAAADGVAYVLARDSPDRLEAVGDGGEELVFRLFEESAGYSGVSWGWVSDSFAEELFDPESLGGFDVVSAPGTVAFVCNGSFEHVRDAVCESLEGNGWTRVPSDAESMGNTFVKDRGVYRWAFVTCSEISGTVTVSVTVVGEDDVT